MPISGSHEKCPQYYVFFVLRWWRGQCLECFHLISSTLYLGFLNAVPRPTSVRSKVKIQRAVVEDVCTAGRVLLFSLGCLPTTTFSPISAANVANDDASGFHRIAGVESLISNTNTYYYYYYYEFLGRRIAGSVLPPATRFFTQFQYYRTFPKNLFRRDFLGWLWLFQQLPDNNKTYSFRDLVGCVYSRPFQG